VSTVGDPLQLLHDVLGAEVIEVATSPPPALSGTGGAPGPEEISEARQELHSAEVLEEIPELPDDDEA
jgi:hypothetical protein